MVMTQFDRDNKMMLQTFRWMLKTTDGIYNAGGNPSTILEKMPEELLLSLIRNNIIFSFSTELSDEMYRNDPGR